MHCPKCGHRWKHKPYETVSRNRVYVTPKGKRVEISIDRYEYDGDWMAQFMPPGQKAFRQVWGSTAQKAYNEAVKSINA